MSSDSTPTGTPLQTPEGSIYTPSSSSRVGSDSLSFSTSSFVNHPSQYPSHDSDLSLVLDDGANGSLSDGSYDDAEAEWQESLQQLELMVSLVIIPFFGKWVGRKCAYWAWLKFMTWKHPSLEVHVTNRRLFNTAGVVAAISTPGAPL